MRASDTSFTRNGAINGNGGVVCLFSSSQALLTNCTATGNSAGLGGGVVHLEQQVLATTAPPTTPTSLDAWSCVLSGNVAGEEGGAVATAVVASKGVPDSSLVNTCVVRLMNCTLDGNIAGAPVVTFITPGASSEWHCPAMIAEPALTRVLCGTTSAWPLGVRSVH